MAARLPVLFLGHGNPMNALADNAFSRALGRLGRDLPRPKTVLCVSAHWMTEGFAVTADDFPDTIHDFSGFPPELQRVVYEAPGSPALAARVRDLLAPRPVEQSLDRGLDHGAWSVLRHVYPAADLPVVQLSVDPGLRPREHWEAGKALRPLRDEGILLVGSGNIVHDLRRMDWTNERPPYPWAVEFDAWVAARLKEKDVDALLAMPEDMPGGADSIPTSDHWLPFVTVLGAADGTDAVGFPYEGLEHASMSMRCVRWG